MGKEIEIPFDCCSKKCTRVGQITSDNKLQIDDFVCENDNGKKILKKQAKKNEKQ